jgi:hypothetical protein
MQFIAFMQFFLYYFIYNIYILACLFTLFFSLEKRLEQYNFLKNWNIGPSSLGIKFIIEVSSYWKEKNKEHTI